MNRQRFLAIAAAIGLAIACIFGSPGTLRADEFPPARGNLGNDVLYYIVVDRFYDGEPDNNVPDFAFPFDVWLPDETLAYHDMNRFLLRHEYDPTYRYIGMYWGGDLEGVIQKLDYLQDLGVTKLVLSPIQDNANGILYSPGAHSYLYFEEEEPLEGIGDFYSRASSAFHGYWTKDWFEIDEHFRNPDDEWIDRYAVMRRLLTEADKRGIGIILDLTLNHTSPFHYSSLHPSFYPNEIGFWFADNGAVYRHGQKVVPYWNPSLGELDPEGWFHYLKGIDFDRPTPEMLQTGTLPGGLPDLAQENPEVESYLLDAVRFWLEFNYGGVQIAGFRLDAVKHIGVPFWQKLEDTVLSTRPDAILIGEYFSAGYRDRGSIDWYEKTKGYTWFDFDLSMAARRYFARDRSWDGRSAMLRESLLGREGKYYNYSPVQKFVHWLFNPSETLEIPRESIAAVSDADAKGWVNFVENHDEPRLLTQYPNMSDKAYESLIEFVFCSPGVPMIMYGMETGLAVPYHPQHVGLFGMGGDPFNRQWMIWPGDPGWNPALYEVTRAMTRLRQEYPLLRYGDTRFLFPKGSQANNDLFMLRQSSSDSESEASEEILYAYSTFGGEFLLDFSEEGLREYQNVETQMTTQATDDLLPIHLEPEASKVFVLR